MSNDELVARIAAAAPDLQVGQYAVVALNTAGELWNTDRSYTAAVAAFAQQTKQMNSTDCNAYVVKRHAMGVTVFIAPNTMLGYIITAE